MTPIGFDLVALGMAFLARKSPDSNRVWLKLGLVRSCGERQGRRSLRGFGMMQTSSIVPAEEEPNTQALPRELE